MSMSAVLCIIRAYIGCRQEAAYTKRFYWRAGFWRLPVRTVSTRRRKLPTGR